MTRILFRDLPDANLWRRLAAGVYDGLLLLAIWFALGFIAAMVQSARQPPDMTAPIAPLVAPEIAPFIVLPVLWLVAAAFYGWFWRHGGQTLGMKTWRLRLVSTDDSPIGLRQILVRAAVGTVALLVCLAGFLWVLATGHTWHDRASGTRVVLLPRDSA